MTGADGTVRSSARNHPWNVPSSQSLAFLAWKGLLLAVALASGLTGPSYDTSTTLALNRVESSTAFSLVTRLTRWDAIYFTSSAQHGYRFEQEWAFGPGLPAVVAALAHPAKFLGLVPATDSGSFEAAIAIFVSHAAHFAAVFTLYELVQTVWGPQRHLPLISALMHILSPAGLFLSAPYAESSFALLSFVGYLLLAKASQTSRSHLSRTGLQLLAGAVFGISTTFRSNGILNGLPFAAECALVVLQPFFDANSQIPDVLSLVGPLLGGILVAAGSIVPQTIAYARYCPGASEPRPWCANALPSIYNFVQAHYWGVGFLRYWTLSNLPLFLLAIPMLSIMMKSGVDVLRSPGGVGGSARQLNLRTGLLIRSMAASQVLLAVVALTNYHVQVITRLASGYPVWYIWVAGCLAGDKQGAKVWGGRVVVYAVLYAMIQGALFSAFLPPA
ncbi:GPI mannosyltransferase [Verticillium dahliae VdLs.17]|uniref:GPI mannosyltransferase 2 n=1 Tax=Verticillium dahliae (strain VdLs.17 / ATCC MYA-4575 / FGSC 10137) TaxID=498257 RepID=G2X5A2_VERDV|nr:GPI mannosyltransferase [Verticillium dahliae VdLs.17]EGY14243.1 GPI mannosyltransferase [Verticillium dahliae VdLs.17]